MKVIVFGVLLSLIYIFPPSVFAIPAFPGAEGFGSLTIGGRGGKIVEVTNLNDSGTGSFRDAVETKSGSRIVIFRVGGTIQANSIIYIKNPFITIAGQTAPGSGITIKGSPIFVQTNDVIIRGLKMRIGDGPGADSLEKDGISVWGENRRQVSNVIIDHNSISWGVDENLSLWDESDNQNTVTFSWNIISEALNCSIHFDPNENDNCHSMGMLINSPRGNISIHHNLFTSNYDRNPAIQSGNIELINNIVYNWGIHPTTIIGGYLNAIGNNYIKTAGTSQWLGYSGIHMEGSPAKVYLNGNIGPGGSDWDTVKTYPSSLAATVRSSSPVFVGSGINATSAQIALTDVLSKAGAIRDSIDDRVIQNVKNGTSPVSGKWFIDSQNEVGGWSTYSRGDLALDSDNDHLPDYFEQIHGGDLDPSAIAPSGYSWIEEYLNSFFSTTPIARKSGDANRDNLVNGIDYVIWHSHFGQSHTGPDWGDFDDNGRVDTDDYDILIANYGK